MSDPLAPALASPLQGRRILLTRPEDDGCEAFIAQLQAWGADVVHLPLIEVHLLPLNWPDLNTFDWLFMTSKNAVRALQAAPVSVQATLKNKSIAVVGPATEQLLKDSGYQAAFVSPVFDAESAAQAFAHAHHCANLQILWPNGNLANTQLQATLTQAGARVIPLTVYETTLKTQLNDAERQILATPFDLLIFTSPSTVESFTTLTQSEAKSQPSPLIACLGPKTRQSAMAKLGHVDIEPVAYTLNALAEAIHAHYKTLGASHEH